MSLQEKAASAVSKAVRQGILPRASTLKCADCSKPATQYDHRDYRNPLDVQPVCQSCNNKRGSAAGWNPKTDAAYKSVKINEEDYNLLREHALRVGRKMTQVLERAVKSYCQ